MKYTVRILKRDRKNPRPGSIYEDLKIELNGLEMGCRVVLCWTSQTSTVFSYRLVFTNKEVKKHPDYAEIRQIILKAWKDQVSNKYITGS